VNKRSYAALVHAYCDKKLAGWNAGLQNQCYITFLMSFILTLNLQKHENITTGTF